MAGIGQVRNVGPTIQQAILQAKDKCGGSFKSFDHFINSVERRKVNVRVVRMLVESGSMDSLLGADHKLWKLHFEELFSAYGTKKKFQELCEQYRRGIEQEYKDRIDDIYQLQQDSLNFKLDNDIYGQYRKLCKLLNRYLPISKISDIKDALKDERERLYIAQATSVKFGYRDRVAKVSSGSIGTADALGGVYGNLDDGSSFIMGVYGPKLYKAKKEEIESIKGTVGVFKATHPWARKSNIFVTGFERLEDLASGRPGELELNIVKNHVPFPEKEYREELHSCTLCPLHAGCKKPVPATVGRLNIMVVGEAPGKEEDEQNKGFVGKSGRLLFDELEKVGISRSDCIVTNVVHCRPPGNKLPNINFVNKCPWLGFEIENLKPKFILASGNAALYFFRRLSKGILEWNAKTEWNNRANAWVTYCIHPASVSYHAENMVLLRKAVKEFATVVTNFA